MQPETELRTESPRGDTPSEDVACADCGAYRELVGPISLEGDVTEGGDMVCRQCARSRGCDRLQSETELSTTARTVGEWLETVNSLPRVEQPLRWMKGRYHVAAGVAHVYNEREEDDLSVHQMAQALAELRDEDHDFDVDVQSRHRDSSNKKSWRVY